MIRVGEAWVRPHCCQLRTLPLDELRDRLSQALLSLAAAEAYGLKVEIRRQVIEQLEAEITSRPVQSSLFEIPSSAPGGSSS